MFEFREFRRKEKAQLRKVTEQDLTEFQENGVLQVELPDTTKITVSIGEPDLLNGSPKLGDMIARNPKNYFDQWLVAKQYFEDNFDV